MHYEIEELGKYRIFHIVGNIDSEASTKLIDDEISQLTANGHHHFVFNLERTTFLDSAGISIFIHCLCDVQENKGSIALVAHDSQVRKVLEMVGLTRLIKTYHSLKEFKDSHRTDIQ